MTILSGIIDAGDFKSKVQMAYGTVSSKLNETPKLKVSENLATVIEPSLKFANMLATVLDKSFSELDYEHSSDEEGFETFKITKG